MHGTGVEDGRGHCSDSPKVGCPLCGYPRSQASSLPPRKFQPGPLRTYRANFIIHQTRGESEIANVILIEAAALPPRSLGMDDPDRSLSRQPNPEKIDHRREIFCRADEAQRKRGRWSETRCNPGRADIKSFLKPIRRPNHRQRSIALDPELLRERRSRRRVFSRNHSRSVILSKTHKGAAETFLCKFP